MDVGAMWFSGGVEVVAGGACVDYGSVVGLVVGWGDYSRI